MAAKNKDKNGQTNSIGQVRYTCCISAYHSVNAIPGALPITHCGPGCADKQYESTAFYNGYQGGGHSGGSVVPSTNLTEKDVVFGGIKRLREQIKATLRIMESDLYVVLNGCIGELVGDDVGSVVSEFQEQNVPIVYAETGGFKGNNYIGHEIVVKAIIDQYVDKYAQNKSEKNPNLINVWTELPYQDTFWRGDLQEIKRILEGAGFQVNILFGIDSKGVEEWKTIPNAAFNLVISPWLGLDIAKHLEEKYGQPYLHIPAVPIGAGEVRAFIDKVVDFAVRNKRKANNFLKKEEEVYYKYLEYFQDFYSEYWWGLPSKYSVIADSTYTLSINRFLVNQLGLIPSVQVITDNAPEKYRKMIKEQFADLGTGTPEKIEFVEDGYIAGQLIKKADYGGQTPIIFGSAWDRDVVHEIEGCIVEVGFPVSYEVVINRTYVGYRGALALIEKIYTAAISRSA